MEIIYETELSIPLIQLLLLLTLSSLALLFHKLKLALLINYLFTLYWGYILNVKHVFGESFEGVGSFAIFYFGFGLLIIIFAVIGLLYRGH